MKLLKDILTGIDGETFDNGRVLCLCSFIVYYIMAVGSIIAGRPWTPLDFSAGIGAMAVGFGVNLHLKRFTEPHGRSNDSH